MQVIEPGLGINKGRPEVRENVHHGGGLCQQPVVLEHLHQLFVGCLQPERGERLLPALRLQGQEQTEMTAIRLLRRGV